MVVFHRLGNVDDIDFAFMVPKTVQMSVELKETCIKENVQDVEFTQIGVD